LSGAIERLRGGADIRDSARGINPGVDEGYFLRSKFVQQTNSGGMQGIPDIFFSIANPAPKC